jgi:hypothetical protein
MTMTSLSPNATDDHAEAYYDEHYNYTYEYDYDESVNSIPMAELVPVTLVYALTLILGGVGNVLVIFSVSYYRRMRTVTNSFLLSLACADLLLVLICIPVKVGLFF